MQRLKLHDVQIGMLLARPARSAHGDIVLAVGASISRRHLEHLEQLGIDEIVVVEADEDIPEPQVPAYMDRYEPNFPTHLQSVFKDTLSNRCMQELYLHALGHATNCYRRYRLDDENGPHTADNDEQQ